MPSDSAHGSLARFGSEQTLPSTGASISPQVLRISLGTPLQRIGERTMNFIIWLIVGGIVGWLASVLMKTDGQQGLILNVIVGIVGAMLGGWLISPLVGVGTINQSNFSLPALLVSFVGAAILLAIVNLVQRGRAR
jgi:uncharacterized membrane protein YeaQ/YmgE (transglycosylase-associated protein family)